MEKVAAKQVITHKEVHSLWEKFQSSYREFHSTETALLCINHDLMLALDQRQCVLMVMLDLRQHLTQCVIKPSWMLLHQIWLEGHHMSHIGYWSIHSLWPSRGSAHMSKIRTVMYHWPRFCGHHYEITLQHPLGHFSESMAYHFLYMQMIHKHTSL